MRHSTVIVRSVLTDIGVADEMNDQFLQSNNHNKIRDRTLSGDRTEEEVMRDFSPPPVQPNRVRHNLLPQSQPKHIHQESVASPPKTVSQILHEKKKKTSLERMRVDSKGRNNFVKQKTSLSKITQNSSFMAGGSFISQS